MAMRAQGRSARDIFPFAGEEAASRANTAISHAGLIHSWSWPPARGPYPSSRERVWAFRPDRLQSAPDI